MSKDNPSTKLTQNEKDELRDIIGTLGALAELTTTHGLGALMNCELLPSRDNYHLGESNSILLEIAQASTTPNNIAPLASHIWKDVVVKLTDIRRELIEAYNTLNSQKLRGRTTKKGKLSNDIGIELERLSDVVLELGSLVKISEYVQRKEPEPGSAQAILEAINERNFHDRVIAENPNRLRLVQEDDKLNDQIEAEDRRKQALKADPEHVWDEQEFDQLNDGDRFKEAMYVSNEALNSRLNNISRFLDNTVIPKLEMLEVKQGHKGGRA